MVTSVLIFFAGGVILNGEGTATDTQDILANKGK